MSQQSSKVAWCLKKAERELAEGRKHRGLVPKKPDIQEAKKHLEKAEHNLQALIAFEKIGFSDWSISAAFYSMYHSFLAIIIKKGYESRNQECTIALVELLKEKGSIIIDQEIINQLKNEDQTERHERNTIQLRENFQYGTATSIADHTLVELKELCKKAIEQAKKIVYS